MNASSRPLKKLPVSHILPRSPSVVSLLQPALPSRLLPSDFDVGICSKEPVLKFQNRFQNRVPGEPFLANVILTFTFAICYRPSVCRHLSSVCLSLCLSSVTLVHPTQAVELFGNFFHHTIAQGLFWCQKSLVGDAPLPLKFSFKVTDPPSK